MRTRLIFFILALGGVLIVGAQAPPKSAPSDPNYVKLEARANQERGVKRAQALAELADMDFESAHARYLAGDAVAGEQWLQRARDHAAQAFAIVQSQAQAGHTKGMEKVEIPLRAVSYGLKDLVYDVSLGNRPAVQRTETYFSNMRAHILELMFAPKTK